MPWFFINTPDPDVPYARNLVGPFASSEDAEAGKARDMSGRPDDTYSDVFERDEGYTLPIHMGFAATGEEATVAIFSDGSTMAT